MAPSTASSSRESATSLLRQSEAAIRLANKDLEQARELASRAGLSVDPLVDRDDITTGGFSNTDHIVLKTGDRETDRIAELKRRMLCRKRAMFPENKGEEKWDKKRAPGERRRRIERDKKAPPEPPSTGYIVFLSQMTVKFRHDRPNERHDQSEAMREASKIWKMGLSEPERKYYGEFSDLAKKEYELQMLEYRATGSYSPNDKVERLGGANVWIHRRPEDRNALETEIAAYDSVEFPPRPPEFDAEYEKQQELSKKKRKLKLKGVDVDNVDLEDL